MAYRKRLSAKAHARNVARGLLRRGASKDVAASIQKDIEGGWFTICHYCKVLLAPREVSIDHVDPLSRGGAHERENLVGCCARCNRLKGALTGGEFRAFRRFLGSFPKVAVLSLERRILAGGRMFSR